MRSSDNVIPLHQTQFSEKSPPRKRKNTDVRPREYLISHEVDSLIKQARKVKRRVCSIGKSFTIFLKMTSIDVRQVNA